MDWIQRQGIGSLVQLTAIGPEDYDLHAETEAFSFQSEYKQYNQFALEWPESSNLKTKPVFGGEISYTIPKSGDLIHSIMIEVHLPELVQDLGTYVNWKTNVGLLIIKTLKISIQDEIVYEIDSQFLDIFNETNFKTSSLYNAKEGKSSIVYVHVPFWYTKLINQYFPLLSLHQQEVKINITLRDINELVDSDGQLQRVNLNVMSRTVKFEINSHKLTWKQNESEFDINILTQYITLQESEKRFFINNKHSFGCQQVIIQEETITTNNQKFDLLFNNPVRTIHFVVYSDSDIFDYKKIDAARLILFDASEESVKSEEYFRLVQSYYNLHSMPLKNVYTYSFALQAYNSQPTGHANYSNLKTKVLEIHGGAGYKLKIYAIVQNEFETIDGNGRLLMT